MPPEQYWATTFGCSMTDISALLTLVKHQTIRQTIPIAFGGTAIRLTLSNRFGIAPIRINAVTISVSDDFGRPLPDTAGTLTFQGKTEVDLPLGGDLTSDALDLLILDQVTLIIDIYIASEATVTTGTLALPVHVSLSDKGDFRATPGEAFNHQLPLTIGGAPLPARMLLICGLDVLTSCSNRAFVAFGDSITQMGSWTRYLVKRLHESGLTDWSLINAGISGNRILHDAANGPMMGLFGPAAVKRFSADVLSLSGVAAVAIFMGVNDLTYPATIAPQSESVTAEEMIAGLAKMAEQACTAGIRVFGCTILPFGGYGDIAFDSESKRRQVNDWIRSSPLFNAVFDFDLATTDPITPGNLLPLCDSGDHLHPSDAGGKAMAETIDLNLFRF